MIAERDRELNITSILPRLEVRSFFSQALSALATNIFNSFFPDFQDEQSRRCSQCLGRRGLGDPGRQRREQRGPGRSAAQSQQTRAAAAARRSKPEIMGISVWRKLFINLYIFLVCPLLADIPLFALADKQRCERDIPLRRSCRRRRPSHCHLQTPGQSPKPQARHRQERSRYRPVPTIARRRRRCLQGAGSAVDAGRNPRKAEARPRGEAAALRRG